jgi:hypothetical protein
MVSKPSTATNVSASWLSQLLGDSKVLNIVSNAVTIQNEAALQIPQGLV